jgi:hypothetical protein
MMCRHQRNHPPSSSELRRQEYGLIQQIGNVVYTETRAAGRARGRYRHPAVACDMRFHDQINPSTNRLRRIIFKRAVIKGKVSVAGRP